MKIKGAILVLSGPSGAGKSSLYKILAKEFPKHYFSVSSTTRAMREGEINGVHYNFITQKAFEEGIRRGEFLEWAKVHNYYYGTSKIPVLEALDTDKLVIFDIDVQGQAILKKSFAHYMTSVFITTPNKNSLQERLNMRGSDTQEIIQKRLENAVCEMESLQNYDYFLMNDDLEDCAKQLVCIAKSAFCKTGLYDTKLLLEKWKK